MIDAALVYLYFAGGYIVITDMRRWTIEEGEHYPLWIWFFVPMLWFLVPIGCVILHLWTKR